MSRYYLGQILYFAGAVEVIEERHREPVVDCLPPSVKGGTYFVWASQGEEPVEYAVTYEFPESGMPDVSCNCRDNRRCKQTCKHGYAILEHVAVVNECLDVKDRIRRALEALESGDEGVNSESTQRQTIELATRELEAFEAGHGGEQRAVRCADILIEKRLAERRKYDIPLPFDDVELLS